MRVALVVDTLSRGGAERILVTLANHLDVRRAEVHVVETRMHGVLAAELAPHVRRHALRRRSRWDVGALWRLSCLLDRAKIDIVHTHSHSAAYFVRVSRGLFRRHWRHVVHDHHGPVETSLLFRWLDRIFLRHVDAYIGVSRQLYEYGKTAIGIPATRCRYIPNGIEAPRHFSREPQPGCTVVQVGRLSPEKDQITALRVAARVREMLGGVCWVLVGAEDQKAGDYAHACHKEAHRLGLGGMVTFAGEQRDITPLLRRAAIAVLTSRAEGLPVSLLEAMAWALPVVVTDVGACRAVVEESGGGTVAPAGDVEALASAVADLARNPVRRVEWGARNHAFVLREYGAEVMAERVMKVYEALEEMQPEAGGTRRRAPREIGN